MEQHMVQHASKGITCLTGGICYCRLDGFADGNAETARSIGRFLQHLSSGICFVTGTWNTVCPPDLHHYFSERFLVETDSYHKNFAFESQQFAGKGKGAAPLTGPRFCRQSFNAELFVIPGLGNGCVWFVASRRAHTFVLEIYACRRIKVLFQIHRPSQRRRAPAIKDI